MVRLPRDGLPPLEDRRHHQLLDLSILYWSSLSASAGSCWCPLCKPNHEEDMSGEEKSMNLLVVIFQFYLF